MTFDNLLFCFFPVRQLATIKSESRLKHLLQRLPSYCPESMVSPVAKTGTQALFPNTQHNCLITQESSNCGVRYFFFKLHIFIQAIRIPLLSYKSYRLEQISASCVSAAECVVTAVVIDGNQRGRENLNQLCRLIQEVSRWLL